jgi:hypothetical protein
MGENAPKSPPPNLPPRGQQHSFFRRRISTLSFRWPTAAREGDERTLIGPPPREPLQLALKGTSLAEATCATIRSKLIEIGTGVVRKLTIIRLHLSSHHPLQDLFRHAYAVLVPT